MKKNLKKAGVFVLTLTIFIYIFGITASAEGDGEKIDVSVEELIPEWAVTDGEELTGALGPDALIYEIYSAFKEGSGRALSFFSLAFGLCLCLGALGSFDTDLLKRAGDGASVIAGASLFAFIVPIISEASSALCDMTEFFSTLGVVMSSITLAGGGVNTAAVQAGTVNFTLSLTAGIGEDFLISLAVMILSLGLISSFGSNAVASLSKFLSSVFMWGIGIVSAIIGASLSLQTLIGSASDSVAMRTAKYAASGMLPIVGSTVTASLSTLVSGISYAKGVVGVSAVIIILTYALSPLALLLLYKLSLSLCCFFMQLFSLSGGIRVYTALKRGLDSVIAVYTLMTVIYVFQIVMFMKCGVALE